MSARVRLAAAAVTAGLAAGAAGADVRVRIENPQAGNPVFGPIDIEARVDANEPIDRVEFFLNDLRVGTVRQPPFRVRVDTGEDNIDREFRVIAYGVSGSSSADRVATVPLRVDDQMNLELQQLYVTLTRDRSRVLELEQGDFRIFDNGSEQELVTFGKGELPLTAVLLLDTSESMAGPRFEGAKRGARAFVEGMKPLDEAMLVLFSDRLKRVTPFTEDKAALLSALSAAAVPDGGSAVSDYLYMALKLLESRQGRRVVVLLSDGSDVHSVVPMSEVLWKARTSQALVYWIQVGEGERKSFSSAWRDFKGNDREYELLAKAVEESGGRTEQIADIDQLEAAFRGIVQELREQYALGYYPTTNENDGSWHKVEVRVKGPVRVRTREGYFDY